MIDAAGLRVIRAIADEGSFTGAALSLGYSQPAISQMVRRLEQRSGTVLVERIGRHVRLTEAGQVLARHAVGVLSALAAAEEEVAAIAGLRAGRVRVMAFPSSPETMVPCPLPLVKERFSDFNVTLTAPKPPAPKKTVAAKKTPAPKKPAAKKKPPKKSASPMWHDAPRRDSQRPHAAQFQRTLPCPAEGAPRADRRRGH